MKNQIAIIGLALLMACFVLADQTTLLSNQLSFQTLPLGGMVSLNFDDGFDSAYKYGWPIIKASGLPSTQYIITNYLDRPGYITRQEVLALEQAGAEIGAHTRTHPGLAEIDKYDLPWEIAGSREDLLKLGVKKVETFAYPYGSYNDRVVAEVKKTGFIGARAFVIGLNDQTSNKYLLEHWGVLGRHSWPEIKNKIDSAIIAKKWLIFVFHRIDEDGSSVSVRHEILQQIVDYLKERKILVVTTAEGLRLNFATGNRL